MGNEPTKKGLGFLGHSCLYNAIHLWVKLCMSTSSIISSFVNYIELFFFEVTMLFFKLKWDLRRFSVLLFFCLFLGCSNNKNLQFIAFNRLHNTGWIVCLYINLKMLCHVDVIYYLVTLIAYAILFIYTTYLRCIMIVLCTCRFSQ